MNTEAAFKSCIYIGNIMHRRLRPKQHFFQYPVFMMLLSLDELDKVLDLSPFWGRTRWSIARYKRKDFFGCSSESLEVSIRNKVEKELGFRPEGDIRVLANLRYFAYSMNPLSTYYCFDKNGVLEAIVAEVKNTPWNEKHAYVFRAELRSNSTTHAKFDKAFTVSPFNPVDMQYQWTSTLPDNDLVINIRTQLKGENIVDAHLSLQRNEISGAALNRILIRFPLHTLKVITLIYWQALKLWLRGVPFLGKNKLSTHPN